MTNAAIREEEENCVFLVSEGESYIEWLKIVHSIIYSNHDLRIYFLEHGSTKLLINKTSSFSSSSYLLFVAVR